MVLLKDIVAAFERFAPLQLQENYDNAGLIVGDLSALVSNTLVTIDITEEVVAEAIDNGCQLIVSHHPLTLSGFKSLIGKSEPERCLIKAIKNNIAIYTAHTNIDAIPNGVSGKMADKLGLVNQLVLEPKSNGLLKLVVFVPETHAETVRQAIFEAGGGDIGNYSHCSFNTQGQGTFKGNDSTNPYVGQKNKLHVENEVKIETVLPAIYKSKVVSAMVSAHPYEEVAFDLLPLLNNWPTAGFGIVGNLPEPTGTMLFLECVKGVFGCGSVRYTEPHVPVVSRVAVCGGSGSSLLKAAINAKADVFITGDFKYHQFFDAEKRIVVADIGHYESEQFTKELFFELLTKNFPNFAVRLSQVNSNPIKYL
jgi:dinuclear metal center YbgI/SA1388 family protein